VLRVTISQDPRGRARGSTLRDYPWFLARRRAHEIPSDPFPGGRAGGRPVHRGDRR